MKLTRSLLMMVLCCCLFTACTGSNSNQSGQANNGTDYTYQINNGKANGSFMGPFDTVFQVIMYEEDENRFVNLLTSIKEEFTYYHQLFDKYDTYEGIVNIKSINDQAGSPVEVSEDMLAFLQFCIDSNKNYSSKVDLTLGPVLNIWHDYRETNDGSVPTMDELRQANEFVDISKLVLDRENKTVMIESGMSLDVGAVAKGYACELVKQKLIAAGVDDFLISAGGNVVSHGKRAYSANPSNLSGYLPDCLDYYTVDIQSPLDGAYENVNAVCAITLKEMSAVTSGDYQRYFVGSDGVYYHHLIDPSTLMPPHYFRSVTILTADSGLADFLSSAIFLTPLEDGKQMIEQMDGVEAIWLLNDGTIEATSGMVEGERCHFYVEGH